MCEVIGQLLRYGTPRSIHIMSIIGTPNGVEYVSANTHGIETTLWIASVDPTLNSDSYIVPGLGDAGDLAYGGKE